MARAIWSGSISFGLLERAREAVQRGRPRKSVSFRELRETDGSRVRHKRVAEADGEEVPYEEIVKGYEIAPEQYVCDPDELESSTRRRPGRSRSRTSSTSTRSTRSTSTSPYYLGPDKGAEKAYALLVKAMDDSGKVAIARFVLRNKRVPRGDPADGRAC